MAWMSIESAPRDGTAIAYLWRHNIVSTCLWLGDADQPGWWDLRCEEPARPRLWTWIETPKAEASSPPDRRAIDVRAV